MAVTLIFIITVTYKLVRFTIGNLQINNVYLNFTCAQTNAARVK